MKTIFVVFFLLAASCAHLYKERSYVSEISSEMNGQCGNASSQNQLALKTRKGEAQLSMPVHYDYWWTGPLLFPIFPMTKERPDPSFIKVSLKAKAGVLDRDQLMKTEILIHNMTEPVLPMTVVYHMENDLEIFVIQFDSPKLVDLSKFRLKFPDSVFKDVIVFSEATDSHYVPFLPVIVGNCVTK